MTTAAFPKVNDCMHVYIDAQGRHVCQRLKEVIHRWRFLSPLDGELYQHLLLNMAFRSEIDLLSNSNISKTYKECYLRDLIKQEDAISSLKDAAKRSFSVHYIHRLAKILILQNREASEAVNSKLRDLGLRETYLDSDDKCDDQSHVEGACVDLLPGVGQSTDLISLVGCNPTRLLKMRKSCRHASSP